MSAAGKVFAKLMVDDHMALKSKLARVLGRLQVPVSNGGTSEDQQLMKQSEGRQENQFDLTYMQGQIPGHRCGRTGCRSVF